MDLAVYLPLLLPLCAAAGAWPLAKRLPPKVATWLLTGAGCRPGGAQHGGTRFSSRPLPCSGLPLAASLGHLSAAVIRPRGPRRRCRPRCRRAASLAAAVLAAAGTGGTAGPGTGVRRQESPLPPGGGPGRSGPGRPAPTPTRHLAGPAGSWSLRACWTPWLRPSSRCCWPTSAPTPRAITTCSSRSATSRRRPTRCCARLPLRSATRWNGGPTRPPPGAAGTGG